MISRFLPLASDFLDRSRRASLFGSANVSCNIGLRDAGRAAGHA